MNHDPHYQEKPFSPIKASSYHAAMDEIETSNGTVQKPYVRRSMTDTTMNVPRTRRRSSPDARGVSRTMVNPIDSLPDFTYVLDPVGQILFASAAVQHLFGYSVHEVVGHNIMEFIHEDDVHAFVTVFNDSIMLQSNLFHYHRLRRRHGDYVILETTGHAVYNDLVQTQDADGNIIPACKFFVLSARAYPTKSISAFDNLLEIKLQNEQLKSELRNLNEDDMQYVVDAFASSSSLRDNMLKMPRSATKSSPKMTARTNAFAKRASTGKLDQDHNAMEKSQSAEQTRSKSLTDERNIPRLGMKKENSESSSGTSLAQSSNGSVSDELSKKSKKPKTTADQHTCTDCGTTDSPEWRKGPQGPKTLCNACGLRYSKKQKKTELLLQEQMRRRDMSTPRSETLYELDSQPAHSGSVTPTDRVRPPLSARGNSLGTMSMQWPTSSPTLAHVQHSHSDFDANLDDFSAPSQAPLSTKNSHFWPA